MLVPVRTIQTTFEGFAAMIDVFDAAKNVGKDTIELDWSQAGWFDANMAALLGAFQAFCAARHIRIVHVRLTPSIANILIKNGFLPGQMADKFRTVIPFERFSVTQAKDFAQYTDRYLAGQGMPVMSRRLRRLFLLGLDEIFHNAVIHSKTRPGIFCCGQFYPKNRRIRFTIADLGIGIRQNLLNELGEDLPDDAAIEWAMKEGATTRKGDVSGGIGLKILRDFVEVNRGRLVVVSDRGYWAIENPDEIVMRRFFRAFPGTVVSLEINSSGDAKYALAGEVDPDSIF